MTAGAAAVGVIWYNLKRQLWYAKYYGAWATMTPRSHERARRNPKRFIGNTCLAAGKKLPPTYNRGLILPVIGAGKSRRFGTIRTNTDPALFATAADAKQKRARAGGLASVPSLVATPQSTLATRIPGGGAFALAFDPFEASLCRSGSIPVGPAGHGESCREGVRRHLHRRGRVYLYISCLFRLLVVPRPPSRPDARLHARTRTDALVTRSNLIEPNLIEPNLVSSPRAHALKPNQTAYECQSTIYT